jgi:hypothetical protein
MALWVDEIQSRLGNPILVELKTGDLSTQLLQDTEHRLRNDLRRIDAPAGLLIYFDKERRLLHTDSSEYPYVFAFEVDELLSVLRHESLAEAILKKRDRKAHAHSEGP